MPALSVGVRMSGGVSKLYFRTVSGGPQLNRNRKIKNVTHKNIMETGRLARSCLMEFF
jgi:hypothetical protein